MNRKTKIYRKENESDDEYKKRYYKEYQKLSHILEYKKNYCLTKSKPKSFKNKDFYKCLCGDCRVKIEKLILQNQTKV